MKLSRQQFVQVQHALHSSFNRDELRMLVRIAFGQDLDAVSKDRDLSLQVFDVIIWAEKHDRVPDLIAAACDLRPDNLPLQQIQSGFVDWQELPFDDVTMGYNPQATFSEAYRLEVEGYLPRALALYREIEHEPSLRLVVAERMYSIQRELNAGYVGHDGVVKRNILIDQAQSSKENSKKRRSPPPLTGLLILVVLVLTLTSWTVRSAQASLPGDAVYPIKQWMREQRLSLAPADQRIQVIADNENELAAEAKMLATAQQMRPDARAKLSIESTEPMVYYGNRGDLMMIGPFLVAPNYQPVAGVEDFKAMNIQGTLMPGAVVQLTYKVLPGNPNVVQGVRAVVVGNRNNYTPAPTAATVTGGDCQRLLPASWAPYPVRPGDTLAKLAARAGVSVVDLMGVNCLETASLAGVSQIYLPAGVYVRVTPTAMPVPPTRTSP